jgi:uncharacterized SAM-binding protein YcdF (DUF218 family)
MGFRGAALRNGVNLLRKILILLLVPVLLLAGLYVFRDAALAAIGNFLVVRDKLEPADIIFVLNGDPTVRPGHAAALLRQGMGKKVVIARAEDSEGVQFGAYPNVTDTNIIMLKSLGVPDGSIVQLRPPGGVKHTKDEADALLGYTREYGIHSVIIVTSDLHSRRARFIFKKVLAGSPVRVMLAPISDRKYGADNWWKQEEGLIGCQNEYLKLVYYHLKY